MSIPKILNESIFIDSRDIIEFIIKESNVATINLSQFLTIDFDIQTSYHQLTQAFRPAKQLMAAGEVQCGMPSNLESKPNNIHYNSLSAFVSYAFYLYY